MTPKKQIIAIAELDGWTYYPPFKYHQERIEYTHPERWEKDKQERNYIQQFGAYLTSRDAIIPVIEKWCGKDEELWTIFFNAVGEVINHLTMTKFECAIAQFNMTPSQLAEALLRATNKWEE